jgi:protein O-mannosyl-transferase
MKKEKHKTKQKPKEIPVVQTKVLLRLSLLIVVFSFLIYANTIKHQFVLDDTSVITENSMTKRGGSALDEIFTSCYRAGYNDDNNLYRPLSKAMFAIEWRISPNNPSIHHIVNIVLYSAVCLLLFFVLYNLTGLNVYFIFISVMIFAAHPIHTEVVANIKSRDEILCTLFLLLSLHFMLKYIGNKKTLSFAGFISCFFLALLSKESAIVFIGIVPISVYFFTDAIKKINIRLTISALAVGLLYILIHYKVVGGIGIKNIPAIDNSLLVTTNVLEQKMTAIKILGKYLLLLFFPHPLSSDYSFSTIPIVTSFADGSFILSLIAHIALLFFAIIKFRERNILSYCVFFYLISMSITSNLFILIGTHMAERLLFFPSIAFCLALTYGFYKLFKLDFKDPNSRWNVFLHSGKKILAAVAILLIIFSAKTIDRNKDWKTNTTLFSQDVKTVPNSAHMLMYCADYLTNKDTLKALPPQEKEIRLLKAKKVITKALNIYNPFPDAHYLYGKIWYELKNYDSAYVGYAHARDLNPGKAMYHNNVGTCLFSLGKYEEAAKEFSEAMKLDKNDADPPFNLGSAYGAMGERYRMQNDRENANKMFSMAIPYFEKAIRLKPDYKSAYQFIGATYINMGDTLKGRDYITRAERITQKP